MFVIAAHRSYLDPLFVMAAIPQFVSFVATARLFRRRLLSWLAIRLGCIRRDRSRVDARCAREIIREIHECGTVGLFPEGERSWTGAMGQLKPEAVRLLLRFPDVPVLPLRIDGSYSVWPRWRRRPVPGRVTVTVMQPLKPRRGESPEVLAERLRDLILPDETAEGTDSPVPCSGLQQVLYRCPLCMTPGSLEESEGALECSKCGAAVSLDGSLTLHLESPGAAGTITIPEAYDRVRARATDLEMGAFAPDDSNFPSLTEPGERAILISRGMAVSCRGHGDIMQAFGESRVLLTSLRLVLPEVSIDSVPLADIISVTTEGSSILNVCYGSSRRLLQLRLTGESLVLWQDLLVLATEAASGRAPDRS